MHVKRLLGIERKDTPISYRRTFTAQAILEGNGSEPDSGRIEFVLEHQPLGDMSIRVKFLDEVGYPTAPAISALEEHILELERNGQLP
jgi:hypothetical protein